MTQLLISTQAICVYQKGETERLVGLEVEHQLKLDWLRDQEVRGKTLCQFACRSPTLESI
jgi:hypothetical protein